MQRMFNKLTGIKFFSAGLSVVLISFLMAGLFLLQSRPARAIFPTSEVESAPEIRTNILTKVSDALKKAWKSGADVAFKKGLQDYLNKLAYEAAVSIASGGKGQKPLVELQPGKLLKETADKAAGDYLDNLGKKWGVDVCNLPAPIKVKLDLAVRKAQKPEELLKARCKASDIYKNITLLPNQKLVDFSKNFNLEASEMGAFLKITGMASDEAQKAKEEEAFKKSLEGEFKSLATKITGQVKTPASTIGKVFDTTFLASFQAKITYTGSPLADAFGVFTNTLTSKLLERVMKKGLVSETTSPNGLAGGGGAAAAKATFASLAKPDFSAGGSVDVLNELASCSSYQPGQFNCVIDDKFRTAIDQKLTVKEALNQGFLDGTKTFGYDLNGVEPDFRNGYPYRSLVILRKYRVIPVGWELAAKYLKQFGGGNVTLKILTDEYNNSSSPFYKLVDPDWVLKAPETYCNRQGAGEEVLSEIYINDDGNSATPSVKQVERKDVCVDEKTCVVENNDGSCKQFGTCVEEKPIWRFKGDGCPAYYNTCQTFKNQSGSKVSYLKNTLDYNNCSADNAGCFWYCQDQNAAGDWACTENTGNKLYFDNGVEKCSADNAGCHEYLRILSNTNLAPNGGMEGDYQGAAGDFAVAPGWTGAREASNFKFMESSESYSGSKAQRISGTAGASATDSFYQTIKGLSKDTKYTLSFRAKNLDATLDNSLVIKISSGEKLGNDCGEAGRGLGQTIKPSGSFDKYEYEFTMDSAGACNYFHFGGYPGSNVDILIDEVSIIAGASAEYSEYGSQNQVYIKKADSCTADEVGCKKYTPTNGGDFVPGVASAADSCPAEMKGCQAYQELALENSPPDLTKAGRSATSSISLIPSTANVCSAAEVGCEEYTNLDVVAQGGEGKEYYSSIRECVKPDAAGVTTYYTWVGNDQSGYQLKAYHLVKGPDNGPQYVAGVDSNLCTEAIFLKGDEPDCTQFYDAAGAIYYRLKTKTITASDDCHPLRNTLDEQTYNVIPSEARSCSADKVGCRAYKGPSGDNIREVLSDNFEDGDTAGWEGDSVISTESVYATGHSMNLKSGDVRYDVSDFSQGKPYLLSFWAKGSGSLTARIVSSDASKPEITLRSQTLSGDWQSYKFGPVVFDRQPADHEYLYFSFSQSLFIDNIKFQEVTDNLYLIKDSYQLCTGNEGCQEYKDDDGNLSYLKSFTRLCQENKIGCERMIDTKNSSSPFETTVNGVTTPADSLVTIVNNKDKYCQAEQKGCELFGQPTLDKDGVPTDYTTVALKNNPDRYAQSLCSANENLCKEYQFGDSASKAYFKDPADKTCEYRKPANASDYGWYQKGTDLACPTATPPTETRPTSGWVGTCDEKSSGCNEYFDPQPTEGNAVSNNSFEENLTSWTPSSHPNRTDTIVATDVHDGNKALEIKGTAAGYHAGVHQTIKLESDKWYTLSLWAKVAGDDPTPSDLNLTYAYVEWNDPSGTLHQASAGLVQNEQAHDWKHYQMNFFFNNPGTSEEVIIYPVTIEGVGKVYLDDVKLVPTSAYYYLAQSVDQSSCNGVYDPREGCLLFNDTTNSSLNYSSNLSEPGKTSSDCSQSPQTCDSNTVLKVERDRTCAKWLYCKTKWEETNTKGDKEQVCSEIGLCDKLGTGGECVHSLPVSSINQTFKSPEGLDQIKNLSGLSVAGIDWGGSQKIEGYFNYAAMEEKGLAGAFGDLIKNGDFEMFTTGEVPPNLGDWESRVGANLKVSQDSNTKNKYLTVDPADAQPLSGVKIPLNDSNGKSLIKNDQEYTISFKIRYKDLPSALAKIQVGFRHKNDEISDPSPAVDNFGEITASTGWQEIILGPLTIRNSSKNPTTGTYLAITKTAGSSGEAFEIDDVSLKPILKVQSPAGMVSRSCRMYPTSDSLTCNYTKEGKEYNGWMGYCVEKDPKNPNYCLSWWPVDVLAGESNVFGAKEPSGYVANGGKTPLYYCLEPALYNTPTTYDYGCVCGWESKPAKGTSDLCKNVIGPDGYTNGGGQTLCRSGYCDFIGSYGTCGKSKCSTFGARKRKLYCVPWTSALVEIPDSYQSGSGDSLSAQCKTIVQVVDENNANSAWVERVKQGSNYSLAYPQSSGFSPTWGPLSQTSDAPPFGRLVEASPLENTLYPVKPSCQLKADGTCEDASSSTIGTGTQASAPNPYTLTKLASAGATCTGHSDCNTGVSCDQTQTCNNSSTTTCTSDYQCMTGISCVAPPSQKGCSNNHSQICSSDLECNSGVTCSSGKVGICSNGQGGCEEDSDCYVNHCITITAGTCKNSPSTGCNSDDDCNPSVSCSSNKCVGGTLAGQDCAVKQDCYGDGYYCEYTNDGKCSGGPRDTLTCKNFAECVDSSYYCKYQTCTDKRTKSCTTDTECYTSYCLLTGFSSMFFKPVYQCKSTESVQKEGSSVGINRLKRIFAEAFKTWEWDSGESKYVSKGAVNTWGPPTDICRVCQGGSKNGRACSGDTNCSGGGVCAAADVHPAYNDLASERDYCGVQPKAFNLKIGQIESGKAGEIRVERGQSVALTFNSGVNGEQKPLANIEIDWGDSQDYITFGAEPKSDPAHPHRVTHTYDNAGTYVNYPRIQVIDNWGWCSNPGATTRDSSCDNNSNNWIKFGGTIIVP